MEAIFSLDPLFTVLLIFGLRVSDMTLDTLRILYVLRGRRLIVWVLGFIQSTIFLFAITSVLQNLDNPLNILSFAAGFATGNVIGMWIEERLAIGYTHLRLISTGRGSAIAERLRGEGYAVTEIPARGKDGAVTLINCSVLRRQVGRASALAQEMDSGVFITAEDVRPVRRGFWRS